MSNFPDQTTTPKLTPAGKATQSVRRGFRWLVYGILTVTVLTWAYWIFASDRYVSNATIIIQRTDNIAHAGIDLGAILGGGGGANRPDQLLLREYILSVDMLHKLDKALDLRTHFSDSAWDAISRMWFHDTPIERFHKYYLSRVHAEYDDYSGVLRIRVQAFTPQMAHDMAQAIVTEGERYMNELGHQLARAQVTFLEAQITTAHAQALEASQAFLDFQNQKGLVSPQATSASIHTIIASLEEQRTKLQTQIASLPRSLSTNHPNVLMLQQALKAVKQQIAQEQAKLASTSGKPLNSLVAQEQTLSMDLNFKQDIYKTALVALEVGRTDATRTLKQVSILQNPVLPEYPEEPRRLYGFTATAFLAALAMGIATLIQAIILDHVD